jgi:hypothetical protein
MKKTLVPILSIIILTISACATPAIAPSITEQPLDPTAVPPIVATEASAPVGWETYTSPRFQYSLSYPTGMEVSDNGEYSVTFGVQQTDPGAGARNFVYVSVIPAGFQSEGGDIYNYNTSETDILLNMQVGESKALREFAGSAEAFTYTRLADTTIGAQTAKMFENTQPWEFPEGTKEIRYYLQMDEYTYLFGAYVNTNGSTHSDAITEELFDQIVATFRLIQ